MKNWIRPSAWQGVLTAPNKIALNWEMYAMRRIKRIQRYGTKRDKVQIRRIFKSGRALTYTLTLREFEHDYLVNRFGVIKR